MDKGFYKFFITFDEEQLIIPLYGDQHWTKMMILIIPFKGANVGQGWIDLVQVWRRVEGSFQVQYGGTRAPTPGKFVKFIFQKVPWGKEHDLCNWLFM